MSWLANLESDVLVGGGYDVYRAVYWQGGALSYLKRNSALITASSYVDDPTPPGGIPNDKDVYYRYHIKAKDSQGLFSSPSEDFWFYMGRSTSGSIGTNATWNQNRLITANVTINNGVTITLSPGITMRSMSGTTITGYGKLVANGTSGSKITLTSANGTGAGSWGSITLSGSGATNSSIKHANVLYGTQINVLNGASNVDIEDCNITNTYYGIR